MRSVFGSILVVTTLGCSLGWGQAPGDCAPSELNIPEANYPCVYPDNRAMFRVVAPGAETVRIRIGQGFEMSQGSDGVWSVTTTPLVVGFHYYTVEIDGANVADPSTMTFFGSGWQNSAIEIPEPGVDFYRARDVLHGRVSQQWYFSTVTDKWRRSFVYTPPDYDTKPDARYPVLYLLHGWGEDETGWYRQGHVEFIMDNLIADGKATPMIVVMDNLNAVKPGESGAVFAARGLVPDPPGASAPEGAGGALGGRGGRGGGPLGRPTYSEMMLTDLIPAIEKSYRVAPGRENRAMAGLSMGGAQAFETVLKNPDEFAYLGGFSGNCGGFGGGTFDPDTSCDGAFRDPAAFNAKMKVLFLGIGSAEGQGTRNFSDALREAGVDNVYFESPGTAHEWLTWRRSLNDFAPRLFN